MTITVETTGPVGSIEVETDYQSNSGKGISIDLFVQHLMKIRQEQITSKEYKNKEDIKIFFSFKDSNELFGTYCISYSKVPNSPIIVRISN